MTPSPELSTPEMPATSSQSSSRGASAARPQTGPRYSALSLGGGAAATRVAVVGAGFIADFHLEILSGLKNVELVAVCDPALDRAKACADRFSVPHTVASIAELKELRVDVAHLLAPPDLHVRLTEELLDLGIGVFLEKPAALESKEAARLQAKADDLGLPLGVNHNNLFHPSFAKLVEQVERGDIGKVEHVRVCLSVPLMQLDAGQYSHWMFRAPRNIVFEQAVHPLCQVHRLIGKVTDATPTILGTRELNPGQIFHDRWLASATGASGASAEIYLAFGQGFTRSTFEVIGSDGSLEADLFHDHLTGERKTVWLDFYNSFLAGWRRGGRLRRSALKVVFNWSRFTLGLGRRQDAFFVGMRESAKAFHAKLRERAPLPVDGASAAEVLEWCEAVAGDASGQAPPAPAFPEAGAARKNEVCVFGAAGFIGRRAVKKLIARGENVTAIVRRTNNLPPELVEPALEGKLRICLANLEDHESLTKSIAGASSVLSLATGNGDTWEQVERSMVRGSVAVGEACLAAGAKRMVYVSSIASLYTAPEEDNRTVTDATPVDPQADERALYSRGKIAAEEALMKLHRDKKLPLAIARPGVVVGEGTPMQHSGYGLWARDNHCVAWGDGENRLPLVWVDDVAEALVAACLHEGTEIDGKAFNLCARVPLNAREIVEELRTSTGRDLNFHKRSMVLSQGMEIGKWLVKKAGRRKGVEFPSWRDLKARALDVDFPCRTARDVLGWKPVEQREAFLDAAIRVYGK